MSIAEYGVPYDFFHINVDVIEPSGFPCCVCVNVMSRRDEKPCRYCGHNDEYEAEFYSCSICGSIVDGHPNAENIIAKHTAAEITRVCDKCCKIIKQSMEGRDVK